MNFEQAITRLQDTMPVMADIQRQQAEVQQMQAKHLAQHEQRFGSRKSMRLHEQRMSHVDMRLAEITDKLDGLIGFHARAISRDRKSVRLILFFRVNSSPVQTSLTEHTL